MRLCKDSAARARIGDVIEARFTLGGEAGLEVLLHDLDAQAQGGAECRTVFKIPTFSPILKNPLETLVLRLALMRVKGRGPRPCKNDLR